MNTRVQLEFSEVKIKELESLMKELGIVTRKDLFNNALTLFIWAVDEKRGGRTIASIDNETHRYKELLMPALAAATNRGRGGGSPTLPAQPEKEEPAEIKEISTAQGSSW